MAAIFNENRISFTELAKREKVALSTTWRWALRGVRGVRLETYTRAGRRFTSLEAFQRFVEATTAASSGSQLPQKPATNRQRERDYDKAEKYFDDL